MDGSVSSNLEHEHKRKFFGTDGVRGCVGQYPITPEFILKLGWAAGKILAKNEFGKVLIGKDTRVSGYMFESALEAGLTAAGMDILLLGPMPTPGIAYLTRTQRADAGIVISASHNLYQDNGVKFFSKDGFKLSDKIEAEIEALLDCPMTTVSSEKLGKAKRFKEGVGRYIEYCKSTVSSHTNLGGLKIVIDCANGATYHIAPSVFSELGAEVIPLGVDPNGYNINLNCGSTSTELLKKKVLETSADLGIAFDGDGDRLMMVDHNGVVVDGDELLYIISIMRKDINKLNGGVVGTLMSNIGLEKAFSREGIAFKRAKVGDRYVLETMVKNGWELGGEQSGHIISLKHATTGDGIISALQVVSAVSYYQKSLAELKLGMHKFPQLLVNIRLESMNCSLENKELKAAVKLAEKRLGDEGRVLIRKSGTEPLLRIMVEGDDDDVVKSIASSLSDVVRSEYLTAV